MDALAVLRDLIARPRQALEQFWGDLSPAVLNAHPGEHPNSVAWLVWHAARQIDGQLSDLSGAEPVWTAQGFDVRFDLGLDADDIGYGHTAEQARAVVVDESDAGKRLLQEHLDAVTAAALAHLDTLAEADLDEVVDASWDPPVTRGVRVVSIANDAAQHVAQAAYVAGMMLD